MNKLEIVRYILNHDEELMNWYCRNDNDGKDGFNMPYPDDLTFDDVTTHGTGFWGDIADMVIEDGIARMIIREEDVWE